MRFLIVITVVLVIWAQHRYWLGDSGFFAVETLRERVAQQARSNARLEARNRLLRAEVHALKNGLAAVEARARSDLGMVAEGESFYLVVDRADSSR